jgi:hypothetical protein
LAEQHAERLADRCGVRVLQRENSAPQHAVVRSQRGDAADAGHIVSHDRSAGDRSDAIRAERGSKRATARATLRRENIDNGAKHVGLVTLCRPADKGELKLALTPELKLGYYNPERKLGYYILSCA